MEILERRAAAMLAEYRSVFRVTIVNGPRQAGKSTLLGLAAQADGAAVFTLDSPSVLRAVRTDPTGFIDAAPKPLFLDEVQRGGDPLILAIKADVDTNPSTRGRFVLSGSSKFLAIPTLSESLAGRAGIVDLWPLAQTEIESTRGSIVDLMFDHPLSLRGSQAPTLRRTELIERIVCGGFPEVLGLSQRQRKIWFDSYLRTIFQRELAPLLHSRESIDLRRVGAMLAAHTAQEMNVSNFAQRAKLTNVAATTLLQLFESIYFHFSLPGWSNSPSARVRRRPKVHLVDSGIAAHLRQQSVDQLVSPLNADAGPLVETFVVSELLRSASWSETQPYANHFRDSENREVDLLLESPDGRLVAVEVKTAVDVNSEDFRWMRYLRDRMGEQFVHGFVCHFGDHPLPFGDRMTALPISTLWRLG